VAAAPLAAGARANPGFSQMKNAVPKFTERVANSFSQFFVGRE